MYYKQYSRIRRMQDLLEKIAYVSVGTDFLIAGSTYLVLRDIPLSNSLLMVSDYLDFVIVAAVVIMFSLVVLMKGQDAVVKKAKLAALKWPVTRSGMRQLKLFLADV